MLQVSLLEVSLQWCPRRRCPGCDACVLAQGVLVEDVLVEGVLAELPRLEEVARMLDKDSERIMFFSFSNF